MIRMIKGIAIVSALSFTFACNDSKQSGDGETGEAQAAEEEATSEDAEEEVDPFAALYETFKTEMGVYATACKSETTIEAPPYNFYTGFGVDSTRVFTNIAGVSLFCSSNADALIAAQDAIIIELDKISNPIDQDAKLQEVMQVFSDAFAETGLVTHFEGAVAATTATFGAGLVKKEDFLFSEGLNFFVASSFDATAAGATDITFTYDGKTVSSQVVVSEYTEAQLAAGQARYENAQGNSPSCASCHQQANGTDHSPLKIGTCSDAEIVGAITAGIYTADATNPNSFCANYQLQVANHSWEFVDDAQVQATIAYLRTLPLPISNPAAAAQ